MEINGRSHIADFDLDISAEAIPNLGLVNEMPPFPERV
jgi:hypothetical protein